MSVKLMAQVWEKQVKGNQRDILLILADHANDDGVCWPAVGLIAWKLDIDRRTVQRNLATLKEDGIVEVREYKNGGRNKAPVYRIHVGLLPDKTPYEKKGGKLPPHQTPRTGEGEIKGGNLSVKGGIAAPPQPPLEPKEHSTEIVPPTTSTELSLPRGERSAPRPAPGEKKKEPEGDAVVEQQKRLAFNLLRAYCDQLHEIVRLTDGERGQLVKQVLKAIKSGEETITIKRALSRMVTRRDEGVRLQFKDVLKDIHDQARAQEKRDKKRKSSGPPDLYDILAEREEYRASIGLPPLSSLA